jgi:riboflavin kinase/FMN adenylyltransferase
LHLLDTLGASAVCVVPFTPGFSRLEPEAFAVSALVERLHARWVVVGENFRFGHRAAGDLALLSELGEKYDFAAEGVRLLDDDGSVVSSSAIREMVAAGDMAAAARDLGRPHRVEGVVVPGHRRGRAMGFPTANLRTMAHAAVPADGVYAGWLAVVDTRGADTSRWPAAISVGTNPTFGGGERTVEAYALDRDDLDLYGEHAGIDFAARLRGMATFDSTDTLMAQMRTDVDEARAIVG